MPPNNVETLAYAPPAQTRRARPARWLRRLTLFCGAIMLVVPVIAMADGHWRTRDLAICALVLIAPIYVALRVRASSLAASWLAVALAAPALILFVFFWNWLARELMPWDWDFDLRGRLIACNLISALSAAALIVHFRCDFKEVLPLAADDAVSSEA